MAAFCLEYILSAPFKLGIRDEEIRQHAESGYYAFQDYALPNWSRRLISATHNALVDAPDIFVQLHNLIKELVRLV